MHIRVPTAAFAVDISCHSPRQIGYCLHQVLGPGKKAAAGKKGEDEASNRTGV